jgi:hypothetical protein
LLLNVRNIKFVSICSCWVIIMHFILIFCAKLCRLSNSYCRLT